jgi:MFS family permease
VTNTGPQGRTGVLDSVRATPAPVRYLLGGVFTNQVGAFVQTFLVLYLTVHHGYSLGRAGAALTAYSIGAILGSFLGAELTQRFGARFTITAAMAASALMVGLIPALSRPGWFGVLLVAMLLAGLATQSYRPAAAVMLSELMPEEHRVMAFSMMRIALNLGAAIAPFIAAGLILINWNLLFWADAGTALAYSALAVALLPKVAGAGADGHQGTDSEEAVETREQKRSAYGVMLRDRKYLLFLVSTLFGTVIYIQYTVALPLKIVSEGHPTALYSTVLTASSVILITTELKITTYVKTWRPATAGSVGTLLMALGLIGYGLSGHVAVAIVLSTVPFVAGIMVSGPTMFAHPATYPAAVRARYLGAHQAAFGVGMAVGPTFGVLTWQHLHNGVWAVCGVLGAVSAACAYFGMRVPDADDSALTNTASPEPTSVPES